MYTSGEISLQKKFGTSREQAVGLEVTSYLSAEIDII
jgi:hypothetical protein